MTDPVEANYVMILTHVEKGVLETLAWESAPASSLYARKKTANDHQVTVHRYDIEDLVNVKTDIATYAKGERVDQD